MNTKHIQQGSTLVISLVMLIVLTLLVVSAMKSSTTNLRITSNMQMQEEASLAAQKAIETLISNNFTNPANPGSVTLNVDVNNDGTTDYTANATSPACISSNPLKNSDLSGTNSADADCISSDAATQTGIVFASGVAASKSQSWCSFQQWDILGTATDAGNTVNARVHQGVAMRVPAGTICP